jgi:hypothetical protein
MLYGLAIENLFKAVWILRKHGAPHSDDWILDDEFPQELKTHDLVALAKLVDEGIVKKYKDSLSLLSEAAIWSGRYPCSIKGDEGAIAHIPAIHDDAEKIYKHFSKHFTITS